MTPLTRYWNEKFCVGQTLETDSRIRRLVNTYVVAALMNTFPKTVTRIFARSSGELVRLLFKKREGGSFRVLRAMYRFGVNGNRGDLINRLLMQSPAVKAARNRRKIAQKMLETSLDALPTDRPILVLAIGAGDGRLEAEVLARLKRCDVYYCGVDKDVRAVEESRDVQKQYGLERRGCTYLAGINSKSDVEAAIAFAEQQFRVRFDGIGVCVCQGIAEYLDMDSDSNETLAGILRAIKNCTREEAWLLISQTDHHDRVKFLEKGLNWFMRLRNRDELAAEVKNAGWYISVCEYEPMRQITMCLSESQKRE